MSRQQASLSVSPLRRRMLDDMAMRGLHEGNPAQHHHVGAELRDLPMHVLGKLFRRLFLAGLSALHAAGRLRFFGEGAGLGDPRAFEHHLAPASATKWIVYSEPHLSAARRPCWPTCRATRTASPSATGA